MRIDIEYLKNLLKKPKKKTVAKSAMSDKKKDTGFLGKKRRLEIERNFRTMMMEKEDFLLKQIDEFREKAKQLQSLLANKEERVQTLQTLVDEKEGEATELSNIIAERRTEADKIVGGVSEKMDGFVADSKAQLDGFLAESKGQMKEFADQITTDFTAKSDETIEELKAQVTALKEANDSMKAQMETLKSEIFEKIHDEDVKCYRNMQTLIEEQNEKFKQVELSEQGVKNVSAASKVAVAVSIINFIGIIGLLLIEAGIL